MQEKINHLEAQLREKTKEVEYLKRLLEDISNRNLRELEEASRVTALLREQERVQREQHKAKRIESIGLMAGGVAHDLNNILSGIVSYPELILLKLPDDSTLRDPIGKIHESGQRAAAVVADLLTVARGVASAREIQDINEIVCQYLLSPQHEAIMSQYPGVVCNKRLNTTPLHISCSLIHITKSIMNLVANAAEAIGNSGEITISTSSDHNHRMVSRNKYVILQISDNGPGIEKGSLNKIFEPFYTKKILGRSGTGLGLTVVWNTMEDHNGFVEVDSGKGGSRFRLYFPLSGQSITDEQPSRAASSLHATGTVLIVDDEEIQRDIASEILTTLGYTVRTVASGEEAVSYLRNTPADILLLDMIMEPGVNGYETYKQVLDIYPNQKALIVSGFSESDDVRKACRLGAGGFIPKPYTIEQLGAAVKKIIDK